MSDTIDARYIAHALIGKPNIDARIPKAKKTAERAKVAWPDVESEIRRISAEIQQQFAPPAPQ